MSYLSRVLTTTGLVKLIMLNVCGCLVLCWLVIDDPRRKPALVVLVPAMLLIDLLFVMRMFGNPKGASVSLPIIYLCGLAYGAWWLAKEFEWWKMLVLVIPLSLLTISVRRLIGPGLESRQ